MFNRIFMERNELQIVNNMFFLIKTWRALLWQKNTRNFHLISYYVLNWIKGDKNTIKPTSTLIKHHSWWLPTQVLWELASKHDDITAKMNLIHCLAPGFFDWHPMSRSQINNSWMHDQDFAFNTKCVVYRRREEMLFH